jgi:cold shock CspA family protein
MFGPDTSADYFYARTSGGAPKRSGKLSRPSVPRGTLVTGRIVNLLIGQCHGFIRLPNGREIYFHRADLQEGTAFNDLQIGDAVTFELLEDAVSGARALRVVRRERPR